MERTKIPVSFFICLRDPFLYLISDFPEDFEFFFFQSHCIGRILETMMKYISRIGRFAWKIQSRAAQIGQAVLALSQTLTATIVAFQHALLTFLIGF
jgi:hypothetical protein